MSRSAVMRAFRRRATGGGIGKPLLLAMILALPWSSTPVMASEAPPPIIDIGVSWDNLGYSTYRAHVNELPYSFGTSIEFPGGYLVKGDIYFGVISPGRERIYTWVTDGGVASLKEGLTAIVKEVDMKEKYTFNLTRVLGHSIKYQFTGAELLGMYLVFTLITVSGSDPSDAKNWDTINMRPLVLEPLPAIVR